jgi:ParB-like chromosome segregation protein Spo0J
MKKLTFHPACLLFPQLPKNELRALAADIKANGLQKSIVLYEGKILDGRNRWLACKIAKVKPTFIEWDGKGSPVAWVISENLVRRHLTSSQRAVIALDILPMLEEEAKERQGRRQTSRKQLRNVDNGEARQIAARLAKTNRTYVQALKAISKAAPELIAKVRTGDLTVPDAKRLADIPKDQRRKLLRQANGHWCWMGMVG